MKVKDFFFERTNGSKMIVKFKDIFGEEHDGFFRLTKYTVNNRPAIQLYTICETKSGEKYSEPYANITVNLPDYSLPERNENGFYVFLDNNNFPQGGKILLDNRIGMPTGDFRTSGYCNYEIWYIFEANLKAYRCEL